MPNAKFSTTLFDRIPSRIADRSPITTATELPRPDFHIVTSAGVRMPTHSVVLAGASDVLKSIVNHQMNKNSEKVILIPGVPFEAVSAFIRFLYTDRCLDWEIENYGMHLLTLSHAFLMPRLKQRVTKGLARILMKENVVDVLELAKLCDAPDLSLVCMKLISRHFKTVEKTEGWKILQEHDPWLELDVLQFMDENALRKKRTRRIRREQRLYLQISDAMECLEHICTKGCTTVGPLDVEPSKIPCSKFTTCQGLQMLILHFASCKKRVNGGCSRCKRMWQTLHLHSSICEHSDQCKVPLCRQFKLKEEEIKKGGGSDDDMWQQLVRKVVLAKAISSLTPKAKTKTVSTRVDDSYVMDVHPNKCCRLAR